MQKLKKSLFSPPSLRLNTTVVWEVVLLLVVSLAVLFYYSRQMLRQESMEDAEQTLEATVLQVDNVLLRVEQSAGNIYWELVRHLDQPERMFTYSRRMVECNPNVSGCAIAFKPGYYPGREQFMAYVHRKSYDSPQLVTSEMFASAPYLEQAWYKTPMKTGRAVWMNPLDEKADVDPIITFCLPIYAVGERQLNGSRVGVPVGNRSQAGGPRDRGECIGVFAVVLSIDMLSQIVVTAKPSPHSFCLLLDSEGSFLIHPMRDKLFGKTVFSLAENGGTHALREAAEHMLAGETGNRPFSYDGEDFHVFYKPFVRADVPGRSMENLKWSIGIVYPETDISFAYRHLVFQVAAIAAGGLLLFFLLCRLVFRKQYKPLRKLTERAKNIAEGNYGEKITDTQRNDEIGRLQQHFNHMQRALADKVSRQEQLTATLEERRETLRKTYEQVQDANRVETSLLENMTNHIIAPTEAIGKSVETLCNGYHSISLDEASHEMENIKHEREAFIAMLDQMLNTSNSDARKEESHE